MYGLVRDIRYNGLFLFAYVQYICDDIVSPKVLTDIYLTTPK